jgi:hypothetical protein
LGVKMEEKQLLLQKCPVMKIISFIRKS